LIFILKIFILNNEFIFDGLFSYENIKKGCFDKSKPQENKAIIK